MEDSTLHKAQGGFSRRGLYIHHERIPPHGLTRRQPNLLLPCAGRYKEGRTHPWPINFVLTKLESPLRNIRPKSLTPARKQVHFGAGSILHIRARAEWSNDQQFPVSFPAKVIDVGEVRKRTHVVQSGRIEQAREAVGPQELVRAVKRLHRIQRKTDANRR